MTENTAPAARSPREQMLRDAETHLETITDALCDARVKRDDLTAELRKITAELQTSVAAVKAEIRDLVTDKEEAEALVRSLTRRTRKVQDVLTPIMTAVQDTPREDQDG